MVTSDETPDPDPLVGEDLWEPVRMLVAPHAGVFRPVDAPPPAESDGPSPVDQHQVIGDVVGLGRSTSVTSPVQGLLMGLLAVSGERVRTGQPLAWMRLA